jgi:hypothetical protein
MADDISVTIGAAHAARMVLDILDNQIGVSDCPWLLIGCRHGWLFSGHGHVISLNVGVAPVRPKVTEFGGENSFIGQLLKKEYGDAAETSA